MARMESEMRTMREARREQLLQLRRARESALRACARGDVARLEEAVRAVAEKVFQGNARELAAWLNVVVSSREETDIACTPLHVAAAYGAEECCARLLSYGARISTRDGLGRTAFTCACECGHWSLAQKLLAVRELSGPEKARALMDARDGSGATALLRAASRGHGMVVRELLLRGASATVMTYDGQTVLHMAVSCRDNVASAGVIGELMLDFAHRKDKRCEHTSDGEPQHREAPRKVDLLEVKNKNGETALQQAARCGNGACVRALIKLHERLRPSIDLFVGDVSAWVAMIVWCATWNWLDVLRETLCVPPERLFVSADATRLVEQRRHSVIAWRGEDGDTVMHKLARVGNHGAITILLDAGCSVKATNHAGLSPFDCLREEQAELERLVEVCEVRRTAALLRVAELETSKTTCEIVDETQPGVCGASQVSIADEQTVKSEQRFSGLSQPRWFSKSKHHFESLRSSRETQKLNSFSTNSPRKSFSTWQRSMSLLSKSGSEKDRESRNGRVIH